jgi:hypothetical protein
MKHIFIVAGILTSLNCLAQTKCNQGLVADSCTLESPTKKELVDLMQVKIKNNYQIQFIKQGQKTYLKIIVRDNLGYGKTASLLLYSNKKQYFTKSITLQTIDKTSAYFLVDLNTNYLTTLKDNGLTSIVFNQNVEFVIPKQDSELVKQLAACFFEAVSVK